jgi:6-phosphogluconolactonase (cycloisomerase 2 family)
MRSGKPASGGGFFSIAADGALAPLSPATVATGGQPSQVAPDPTGRPIYVTNSAANTVLQYMIGQDGTLTPLEHVDCDHRNTTAFDHHV